MNDAHLHLVFNHVPIVGTFFGIGILAAGLILKNNPVKNVSYSLFIVTALFAYASMATGDGAAGVVKGIGDITKPMIHKHEEIAEKLAFILYSLAVLSVIGLYADIKKLEIAKWIAFLALLIAGVAGYISTEVGTTGGEIRHTEIRVDAKQKF